MKNSSKRILVIEDEDQVAEVLDLQLSSAGYEVIRAEDGFHGLGMAISEHPDLVLMDICIPTEMGFSVAERMSCSGLDSTPVVFLTGSKKPGLREQAEAIGAAGFLEKPYKPSQLLDTISNTLNAPPPAPVAC